MVVGTSGPVSAGKFRFVHAADLHLDTPFHGLERVSPDVAETLRDASLEAYDALVELALEREAAFLVLAGDLYDGPERGVRAQLRFLRGLQRLAEHGVKVAIAHGNHDPLKGWSAIRQWPPGVTVFGSEVVEAVEMTREGERLATVYGLSYADTVVSENLALRFRRGSESGFHIGVLHCNVGGNADHAAYSPCSLDDLLSTGMDYWALGHVHTHRVLRHSHPWVGYPGSLQGRSTKLSERGPKGALVVEVTAGCRCSVEFVPLDRVRFEVVQVDVGNLPDLGSVRGALLESLEALRPRHGDCALLVRAELHGRGGAHSDLTCAGAPMGLLQELREELAGERPLVWWEAVKDMTGPELQLPAIKERGDFSAELIDRVEGLLADDKTLLVFLEPRLAAALPPLRCGLRGLTAGEGRSILEEAQLLALDLLEAEAAQCG